MHCIRQVTSKAVTNSRLTALAATSSSSSLTRTSQEGSFSNLTSQQQSVNSLPSRCSVNSLSSRLPSASSFALLNRPTFVSSSSFAASSTLLNRPSDTTVPRRHWLGVGAAAGSILLLTASASSVARCDGDDDSSVKSEDMLVSPKKETALPPKIPNCSIVLPVDPPEKEDEVREFGRNYLEAERIEHQKVHVIDELEEKIENDEFMALEEACKDPKFSAITHAHQQETLVLETKCTNLETKCTDLEKKSSLHKAIANHLGEELTKERKERDELHNIATTMDAELTNEIKEKDAQINQVEAVAKEKEAQNAKLLVEMRRLQKEKEEAARREKTLKRQARHAERKRLVEPEVNKMFGTLKDVSNKLDGLQNKLGDMSNQSNKNHQKSRQHASVLSMQTNKHTSNEISTVNTRLDKMQEAWESKQDARDRQMDEVHDLLLAVANSPHILSARKAPPQVSCPDIHYRDGRRDSLSTITTAALSSAQPSSSTGDDYKTPKRSRIPPPSFYRRPPTADKPMWKG